MKATRIAALLVCVGLFSHVASAEPIRWNNVPGTVYTQPPVVVVQPTTIDFSGLANAITQYESRRSSANNNNSESASDSVVGQPTYITGADGKRVKCTRYGENVFCP